MEIGTIDNLYNNYGLINYNDETIPFRVTADMISIIDNKEYIQYTNEVKFKFKSNSRLRNREIREAVEVRFTGTDLKIKERSIEDNYLNRVRSEFKKFGFKMPPGYEKDDFFYEYLKKIGFKPRMLNYLIPGVFLPKNLFDITKDLNNINIDSSIIEFDPTLIVMLDNIDTHFRIYILKWILGIEDAYKAFVSRVTTNPDVGFKIANSTINKWGEQGPKYEKQLIKAQEKYIYRTFSDHYDYVHNDTLVPIDNLMEQLDLKDLPSFFKLFHKQANKYGFRSPYLEKIITSLDVIDELSLLRNDAAHGKSIIPNFTDPDYNGNWDMEFDNIDKRSKVKNWYLFEPLKEHWLKREVSEENIKHIIHTIYGNPYRKAWMELNYIYFSIISNIDEINFRLFHEEAQYFLSYDFDIYQQIKNVNIIHPKLSDMGPTTLENITGIPAPYKEIANEAFDVWRIFS